MYWKCFIRTPGVWHTRGSTHRNKEREQHTSEKDRADRLTPPPNDSLLEPSGVCMKLKIPRCAGRKKSSRHLLTEKWCRFCLWLTFVFLNKPLPRGSADVVENWSLINATSEATHTGYVVCCALLLHMHTALQVQRDSSMSSSNAITFAKRNVFRCHMTAGFFTHDVANDKFISGQLEECVCNGGERKEARVTDISKCLLWLSRT